MAFTYQFQLIKNVGSYKGRHFLYECGKTENL